MQGDKVCIAALHRDGALRLHNPSPREHWLQSIGGLTPGDIVSLTWKLPRSYHRPHVEDRDWNPAMFGKIDRLPEDRLIERLSANAFRSIVDAFGEPCFYSENGNPAFTPGRSSRSLASVLARSIRARPHQAGVRVSFIDEHQEWSTIPLEDFVVRQHQTQCRGCSSYLSKLLVSEFEGDRALLRMGLTRQFQAEGRTPACYLQVNHIFLMPSQRKHFV